ncbi:MAG: DNA mismatch repair endonuclease MutL [Myxococcota bacterium]
MGTTVQKLDATLIDQIAAGEVIERPANLVKELLENALDAGARRISVDVHDGGRAQVRVSDDGTGMSREDARLCVERHATSKIRSFEDLTHVQTLGFRGEALPSIAAVSRLSITTRRPEDPEGTRIVIEGGAHRVCEPCGCPAGTTVDVQDLFYNVPARRKFLKARQTETSKVMEICQRTALIHPDLRLQASSEGRMTRNYPPVRTLAERAYQAFGDLRFDEVVASREGLEVSAVLAPVTLARPGPRHLFIYVNGRPIADRALARAVAFAYGERLPRGHYPRGIVALKLPPEDVDVNAHPQKTEVRFRRASGVVDALSRILGSRLRAEPGGSDPVISRGATSATFPSAPKNDESGVWSPPRVSERVNTYDSRPRDGLRLVAQLHGRHLLCESPSRLHLIDRPRIEQVVLSDDMALALEAGPLTRQALLFPDRLELDDMAQRVLAQHDALIASVGFDWSSMGGESFVLRSIPSAVGNTAARAAFLAALTALDDHGEAPREALIRSLATSGAVPAGEPMDPAAARILVSRITLEDPRHRACVRGELPLPNPEEDDR